MDKNPPTSQERSVQSLIWEDPTCHGATKPMHHHNWSPHALEAVLSKRSYCNERGPCIATKSNFRSPQLEKGCGQQWRPSTTKKKKKYRQPDLIGHCQRWPWSPLSSPWVSGVSPVKLFASSPQSSLEESHKTQPSLKELCSAFLIFKVLKWYKNPILNQLTWTQNKKPLCFLPGIFFKAFSSHYVHLHLPTHSSLFFLLLKTGIIFDFTESIILKSCQ